MKALRSILAGVLMVAVSGCGMGGVTVTQTGSVSGRVVNKADRTGVPLARVTVGDITKETDSQGGYAFTGLPVGAQAVLVTKAGYRDFSGSVVISAEAAVYNVELEPSGTTTTDELTLTSPNGGEYWQQGATKTIRWSYSGSPGTQVKIELLKAGAVVMVLAPAVSLGSGGQGNADCLVPSAEMGRNYRVRVSTVDGTLTDSSDATFNIVGAGDTRVIPPGNLSIHGAAGSGTSDPVHYRSWPNIHGFATTSLGIRGYKLYRSLAEQGPYQYVKDATWDAASSEWMAVDDGIQFGETFYYRVSACTTDNLESPLSPEVVIGEARNPFSAVSPASEITLATKPDAFTWNPDYPYTNYTLFIDKQNELGQYNRAGFVQCTTSTTSSATLNLDPGYYRWYVRGVSLLDFGTRAVFGDSQYMYLTITGP